MLLPSTCKAKEKKISRKNNIKGQHHLQVQLNSGDTIQNTLPFNLSKCIQQAAD